MSNNNKELREALADIRKGTDVDEKNQMFYTKYQGRKFYFLCSAEL
jgi:hypothetical protein